MRIMNKILTIAIFIGSLTSVIWTGSATAEVPAEVLGRLDKGVNISNWFTHRAREDAADLNNYPDMDDFRIIRELGFNHVRIAVDPQVVSDPEKMEEWKREGREDLERAIASINSLGLTVILTMQPPSSFKKKLADDPATLKDFNDLWNRLAKRLAHLPPSFLLFEPLNEPEIADPVEWMTIQAKLAGAIRDGAPRHTLVLSGPNFSSHEDLIAVEPIKDRNAVYAFHYYEPHNFTHQGAHWGYPPWNLFRRFPYPSSPEAVKEVINVQPPDAISHAVYYGEQRWDRTKLAASLDRVSEWSKKHGVPVMCTEMGVFKGTADKADRLRWLRDVRQLLRSRDMGWTHWDYNGGFGFVDGPRGERRVDNEVIKALGMKPLPR